MFRRKLMRLGLLALAALFLLGALGFVALAEEDSPLRVQVAVRPEGLIAPGDVMLNFILENV